MKSNYTKSPWVAVEYAGFHIIQTEDSYTGNDIFDLDKYENAKENAQLAAAAPELLEALILITERFKRVDPLYSNDKIDIERAEQAISKALNHPKP